MEKLQTSYLGEVELEVAELSSGKKKIPHAYLSDTISNNQTCIDNKVQYMFRDILLGEPGHYAAICVISDKNGRRAEAVGETTANTRTSQIMQDYPLQMAYNRAFDSAAIAFLGFASGVVYSDSQIPEEATKGDQKAPEATADTKAAATTSKPAAQTQPKAAKPAKETKAPEPDLPMLEEDMPVNGDLAPAFEEDGPPPYSDDDAPPPYTDDDVPPFMLDDYCQAGEEDPAQSDGTATEPIADADPFDTIITCGKQKDKGWTVRQLAENAIDSLEWIANEMKVKANDKNAQQKELCKLWLAQNGTTGKAAPQETNVAHEEASTPEPEKKAPAEKAKPAAAAKADAADAAEADPFDIIVTVGRRSKNKYSVRQLAQTDIDSLKWVAYTHTANDKTKAQQDACRLWLSQHPEDEGGDQVA